MQVGSRDLSKSHKTNLKVKSYDILCVDNKDVYESRNKLANHLALQGWAECAIWPLWAFNEWDIS